MHVYPTNALYGVFAIPLSSIYCNTLLANLNARLYMITGDGMTYNTGADSGLMIRSPMSSDTMAAEKETMRFSSPTRHLVSVFWAQLS